MGWHRDPRRRYSTLDGSDLRDSAGIYRISEGGACWKIDRVPVSAWQGVASWASPTGRAGHQRGELGDGASPMRQDRASPAKQGGHQEYIDVLSLYRQSLQNKQCFHNIYAYLSAARNSAEVAPNASRRMMNSEVVHREGQDVTKYRRRPTAPGGGGGRNVGSGKARFLRNAYLDLY
jgi:hypothetical protein